jgi:hypothetical protein
MGNRLGFMSHSDGNPVPAPHVKGIFWAARSRQARDQSLPQQRVREFPSSQPPQSTIALSWRRVSREAVNYAYFFSTPNRRNKKSAGIQANNAEQTVAGRI